MKKLTVFLLIATMIFSSCKKDSKHCWQVMDFAFNDIEKVCDKSEDDIQDYITAKWGSYQDSNGRKYYRQDD